MNIINIYENFNSYFNDASKIQFKAIFEQCSKIALKNGYKLYLIGGIVRDLLLNKKSLDVDIAVEGNAIEFAKILKTQIGAKISSMHPDFGTAKVEINGTPIDFASTRSETYPKAGHLPHVDKIGCSLKEDVLRRDFTINSLAISLNQNDFADLIDYVDGFDDLKAKKIRVLHDKSFIDDPTRIIRALKYSTRLGFELEENTLRLQEDYLKNINYDICYKRVKQEIKKTFEACGQGTFDKFLEQGIYNLITSNIQISRHAELVSASYQHTTPDKSRNKFGMTLGGKIEKLIAKYKPKHQWLVYFGIIVIGENIDKLELTKYEKEVIEGTEGLKNKTFSNDFDIYKAFSTQKLETLLILAVSGKEKEVCHYLDNLQKIKLLITGQDLIKLGLKPSKQFNEIFDFVLKKKLKNPAMKKVEEIKLVEKLKG